MIAIYYRWRLVDGKEAQFTQAWQAITALLKDQGSLGSALFTSEDGSAIAIARWPDLQTRQASSARRADPELYAQMIDAIEEEYEERVLHLKIDGWI
jgi:NADPH:quinone reductase-like Zn-dependent oxidoreductase